MGSTFVKIVGVLIGLLVLLWIIGAALPDDRSPGGGSYSSLSDCLSKRETPGMKVGTESNAPAISYCRNWRDR